MPNSLQILNGFTPDQQRLLQSDPTAVALLRDVPDSRRAQVQGMLVARLRELEAAGPQMTHREVSQAWGEVARYAINPLKIGLTVGAVAGLGALVGSLRESSTAGRGAKTGALVGLGVHGIQTAVFAGIVALGSQTVEAGSGVPTGK